MAAEGLGWEGVLGIVLAFPVGMGVLYGFYRAYQAAGRPGRGGGGGEAGTPGVSQLERLEYYERELVDMKIRMDALETVENQAGDAAGGGQKAEEDQIGELKRMLEKAIKGGVGEGTARAGDKREARQARRPGTAPEGPPAGPGAPGAGPTDPSDYVLHLITNKTMTSRDIQVMLKKSREHTSRLMKRLSDEGYVERDTGVRPYMYSISEKGRARLAGLG